MAEKCYICGDELLECNPHEIFDKKYYCGDCAFIKGFISQKELIKHHYFFIHPSILGIPIIENNNVIFVSKKYFTSKGNNDYRKTVEYKNWRKSVFERDNYTCQKCSLKGNTLNAHHIKTFKDYPKLRFEISNGITLCISCHKEEHKKRGKK